MHPLALQLRQETLHRSIIVAGAEVIRVPRHSLNSSSLLTATISVLTDYIASGEAGRGTAKLASAPPMVRCLEGAWARRWKLGCGRTDAGQGQRHHRVVASEAEVV